VYAAEHPAAAILGVINFAGGWTGERCDRSGNSFNAASPRRGAGRAYRCCGYMPRRIGTTRRRRSGAITTPSPRGGGTATFHLFPTFGSDGHRLVDRVDLWRSAAEDCLRRLNLSPAKD
jgi:hypothetical protein